MGSARRPVPAPRGRRREEAAIARVVDKECARCTAPLRCSAGAPGCWCEELLLGDEARAALSEAAGDCVCPDCLAGYAAAAPTARGLEARWLAGAVLILAGALLTGLAIGSFTIGPGAIARAGLAHVPLLGLHSPLDHVQSAIVWQIRAPRVVLGALVGGMLAVAGSAYQGAFRNPLADPYLLGVSAGAGVGATVVIAYASGASGSELLPLAAFVGSVLAVVATYALGNTVGGERSPGTLILAGVAVAAFMTAAQTLFQQQRTGTLQAVYAWILGGLSAASWHDVALAGPYMAVSAGLLVAHRRILDVLSVGDEEASTLGLNVRRTRLIIVVAATTGTAAAVAVSGLIGFVGIIVPHTIRITVSSSYRAIVPLSLLAGAAFLVLADVLARTLLSPAELPIGVVTAFLGAPFFAVVLRTSRGVVL